MFFLFTESPLLAYVHTKVDGAERKPIFSHPRTSFLIVIRIVGTVKVVGEEFVHGPFQTQVDTILQFDLQSERERHIKGEKRRFPTVLKSVHAHSKRDIGGKTSRPQQRVHLSERKEVELLLRVNVHYRIADRLFYVYDQSLNLRREMRVPIIARINATAHSIRTKKGPIIISEIEGVTSLSAHFPRVLRKNPCRYRQGNRK